MLQKKYIEAQNSEDREQALKFLRIASKQGKADFLMGGCYK